MSRSLLDGAEPGRVLTVVDDEGNVGWRAPNLPPGAVVAFARGATPPDWVECNGQELDGNDPRFSALYAAIGVSFGGDASMKRFRVPDLREHFIRGAGFGLSVGTQQGDQSRSHTHLFTGTSTNTASSQTPGNTWVSVDQAHTTANVLAWSRVGQSGYSHEHPFTPEGTIGPPQTDVASQPDPFGDETRPKCIVLLYCIKL